MWLVLHGDARQIPLKDESAHCIVTSPPYWGLRDYKISAADPLGLEPTPELYIQHIVECFREVRRVLRSDGTCWVNYGDSYYGGNKGNSGPLRLGDKQATNVGSWDTRRRDGGTLSPTRQGLALGLKPLDLCMIPARVALALQADGWWLRSVIVWAKNNPMPESVNGCRWERHRIKILKGRVGRHGIERGSGHVDESNVSERQDGDRWADCPGCPKCEPNDGLILRKGAWRPTTAHEYIFLLTKSADYYCDAEAVREPSQDITQNDGRQIIYSGEARSGFPNVKPDGGAAVFRFDRRYINPAGRNLRSVWQIPTQPFPGAHFAIFPEGIPLRCIKAGTSEKGVCAKCGAPWARIVDRQSFDATGAYGSNAPSKNSRMFVDQDPVHDRPKSRKKPAGWEEGSGAHDRIPAGRYGGKWIEKGDEQGASYRLNQHERFYREQGGDHDNPFPVLRTFGWRPSCKCGTEKRKPAVILDPFSGSGTVPLVADKLGRIGIGLDLKGEYCQLAYGRCWGDAALLAVGSQAGGPPAAARAGERPPPQPEGPEAA